MNVTIDVKRAEAAINQFITDFNNQKKRTFIMSAYKAGFIQLPDNQRPSPHDLATTRRHLLNR